MLAKILITLFLASSASQLMAIVTLEYECTEDIKRSRMNQHIEIVGAGRFACLHNTTVRKQILQLAAGQYNIEGIAYFNQRQQCTKIFTFEDNKTYKISMSPSRTGCSNININ